MIIKFRIKRNYFQDTLRLMRISKSISDMKGVNKAVAVMATDKAKFALEAAELITPEIKRLKGSDLVMVVDADSEDVAEKVLNKIEDLVSDHIPRHSKDSPSSILNQEIYVINIGLEVFKEALENQGVKVLHVNWQFPAKGDAKLISILKKMS